MVLKVVTKKIERIKLEENVLGRIKTGSEKKWEIIWDQKRKWEIIQDWKCESKKEWFLDIEVTFYLTHTFLSTSI